MCQLDLGGFFLDLFPDLRPSSNSFFQDSSDMSFAHWGVADLGKLKPDMACFMAEAVSSRREEREYDCVLEPTNLCLVSKEGVGTKLQKEHLAVPSYLMGSGHLLHHMFLSY